MNKTVNKRKHHNSRKLKIFVSGYWRTIGGRKKMKPAQTIKELETNVENSFKKVKEDTKSL